MPPPLPAGYPPEAAAYQVRPQAAHRGLEGQFTAGSAPAADHMGQQQQRQPAGDTEQEVLEDLLGTLLLSHYVCLELT